MTCYLRWCYENQIWTYITCVVATVNHYGLEVNRLLLRRISPGSNPAWQFGGQSNPKINFVEARPRSTPFKGTRLRVTSFLWEPHASASLKVRNCEYWTLRIARIGTDARNRCSSRSLIKSNTGRSENRDAVGGVVLKREEKEKINRSSTQGLVIIELLLNFWAGPGSTR